jgi:hypothetical protein
VVTSRERNISIYGRITLRWVLKKYDLGVEGRGLGDLAGDKDNWRAVVMNRRISQRSEEVFLYVSWSYIVLQSLAEIFFCITQPMYQINAPIPLYKHLLQSSTGFEQSCSSSGG